MNKTVLTNARLVKDPVFEEGENPRVRFSLITNRPYTSKKEGAQDSDIHFCIAFGNTAEAIKSYCVKGKPINVEGAYQSYAREVDGKDVISHTLLVERMEFVSKDSTRDEESATPAPKKMKKEEVDDFDPFAPVQE
jgi:single-stranded DNA-binding protein